MHFVDGVLLQGALAIWVHRAAPRRYGARQASLTEAIKPFLEEVALNEQARSSGSGLHYHGRQPHMHDSHVDRTSEGKGGLA